MKVSTTLIRSLAVLVGLPVLIAGCGAASHGKVAVRPSPSSHPSSTVAASPTPTPQPALPAPAIVQVDNIEYARPQYGLNQAQIVYEYDTEGGITRFSAIYFTPPQGQVGDIRSARMVSIALVNEYHGLLIYSGASQYVTAHLRAGNVPRFNETSAGGLLYRTSTAYPPYNLFTDGANIARLISQAALPHVGYQLWNRTSNPTGGVPATRFSAPLSPTVDPVYTWNPADHGYIRNDSLTGTFVIPGGTPLPMATVVVMQVQVQTLNYIEDVNGIHGLAYTLTGSGPVQVFTDGQEFSGTWQSAASGPPQFVGSNGKPLPVAPGTVWIDLVPQGASATSG